VARTIEEAAALDQEHGKTAKAQPDLDSGRAWLVVVAASLAPFTGFGVAYSIGAVFTARSEDFGTRKGKTTLLFGIANFVYFTGGILTGPHTHPNPPPPQHAGAVVALGVGLSTTSLVDRLWLGYLTYGLGVGIAVACAYVPMVSVVGGWFVRHRTAAVGIAVAGIGLGNLTASYISPRLIDHHGWRGTYRIYAVVGALLLAVALVLARRPPRTVVAAPERAASLREVAAKPSFRLLYASMFVMSLGLFIPFLFLPLYAQDHGISAGGASTLVGIIGGASIFGRLVFGGFGGRMGVLNLYQSCLAAMSVTLLLWLAAGGSYAMLVVFAVVFGVVYGGFIALAPAVTAQVYGTEGLGTVLGALYTAAGFGGIGLYLAGENIEATGRYGPSIVASLVLAALSAALLLPLRRSPGSPAR
jgi:MFS family permease